jgi:serine/threonine protein phosphatase PrpC
VYTTAGCALNLEIAARTHKGRRRRRNEDRAIAQFLGRNGTVSCLLAVADGVGGTPGGDKASQLAVTTLVESSDLAGRDPASILRSSFDIANRAIATESTADPRREGMATTLVAALIVDDSLWVANVGDSRAYLYREGFVAQITQDHSLVAERVRAGLLTEDEASVSPQRNVITRSLGTQTGIETDVFDCGTLKSRDTVLLCSDGLYTMLSIREIEQCASSMAPLEAAEALIRQANLRGGYDNIGVAIARIVP